MFEVEARGKLPISLDEASAKLKSLGGKFLERRKRFSLIYIRQSSGPTNDIKNDPVDLRIRVSNGKSEIVLKYGESGSFDNRIEVSVPIETSDFSSAVELFKLLGFTQGVVTVTGSYKFEYKDIEFVFVSTNESGPAYFEAERLTENKEDIEKERRYIMDVCTELGMEPSSQQEYIELLNSINNMPGHRFDLKKESFDSIKQRFEGYF